MLAARWRGPRDVVLEDVPRPLPRPDQALVAVEWVGLCGSDAEEYVDGPLVITPPVTLGHEIVGVVEEAAADGSGPPVGTRVVVDVVSGCGSCFWCTRHQEGLCPRLVVTGQHVDGGLAEFVVGRADRLVPVPDTLDPRHAALAEPLAVAVRAVRRAGVEPGDGVLVVGGGAVGMLTAQVALAGGAAPVMVLEPDPGRRGIVEGWGASAGWQPDAVGRAGIVAAAFPERGVDVVLECSGRPGMTAEAIRLVRPGGTVVLLGVLVRPEAVDVLDVVLGEKTVHGSAAHMWDTDVAPAVAMLTDGRVDVAAMMSESVQLVDVARAFDVLVDPQRSVIKVMVEVGGEQDE